MNLQKTPTSIYVVNFADGRIKFGITKNLKRRMHTYKQEAVRNSTAFLTWFACKPCECREDAQAIENVLRNHLSEFAIAGHKEWLHGVTYGSVLACVEHLRAALCHSYDEDKDAVRFAGSTGSFVLEAKHA